MGVRLRSKSVLSETVLGSHAEIQPFCREAERRGLPSALPIRLTVSERCRRKFPGFAVAQTYTQKSVWRYDLTENNGGISTCNILQLQITKYNVFATATDRALAAAA